MNNNQQLMNEAEQYMNNQADLGGSYPAEMDKTLRGLPNSSYDTKAEFINGLTIHSK